MVHIKSIADIHQQKQSDHLTLLKPNILLIDDDREVLSVLTLVLNAQGANVNPFYNPIEAIDFFEYNLKDLETQDIDLVLCDLVMKPMNGLDVLDRISKLQSDSGNSLLYLMSANASALELKRAEELGIDGFVEKPMVHQQLATVLSTIIYNKTKSARFSYSGNRIANHK
jgi:CheY-like chemotaxis protein